MLRTCDAFPESFYEPGGLGLSILFLELENVFFRLVWTCFAVCGHRRDFLSV